MTTIVCYFYHVIMVTLSIYHVIAMLFLVIMITLASVGNIIFSIFLKRKIYRYILFPENVRCFENFRINFCFRKYSHKFSLHVNSPINFSLREKFRKVIPVLEKRKYLREIFAKIRKTKIFFSTLINVPHDAFLFISGALKISCWCDRFLMRV
jgi:hypothetical protein